MGVRHRACPKMKKDASKTRDEDSPFQAVGITKLETMAHFNKYFVQEDLKERRLVRKSP